MNAQPRFGRAPGAALLLSLLVAAGAAAQDAAGPPWAYSGPAGPEAWSRLDPSYAACAGELQSPIDLSSASRQDLPDPVPAYRRASGTRELRNGTLMLSFDGGSAVDLGGYLYDLLQAHLHAPSEHTIDGRRFPAELHLVHRHASGQYAVIGVLLEEGAENPDLAPLLPPWPPAGRPQPLDPPVPVVTLLPADLSSYQYQGSLTMPPCTEGVRWLVLATPMQASPAQLGTIAEWARGNSRPIQPRNNRELVLDRP